MTVPIVPGRPHRVLVVDDEPNSRLVFRECLVPEGYEVVEAADGAEGLRLLEQGGFDLVLLDLVMPVLDGPGVIRVMRSQGLEVPVVVVSGFLEGHSDSLFPPVVGAVGKPFTRGRLLAVVRRALRQSHEARTGED